VSLEGRGSLAVEGLGAEPSEAAVRQAGDVQVQRSAAVVLLGAPGSGKTTLARALLATAGTSPATAPAPGALGHGAFERGGSHVWLLDPPGSPDLAGALHAALRVASAVLLVVSPVQGVDPRTVALWDSLEHLPRLVVLTQLDRPGADADEAVAVCRRVLGEGILPLQLPLHDDDGSVGGLLELLHLTVSENGGRRAAEPEHVTLVTGLRAELLEAVLTGSDDEELFERFLDDAEPPPEVLDRELAAAVDRGDLQPVLVTAPPRGVGLTELCDLLATALPATAGQPGPAILHPDGSPADLRAADPGAPLVAEVVSAGLLRVWSGTLRPGAAVLVAGRPVAYAGPPAGPGELVAVDVGARPGEAVSAEPVLLSPWPAPAAQFPVGAPVDDALAARVHADPVARLEPDPDTGQLLLWTYGPQHAEALLAGLPSAPVRLPPGARPVPVRVRVPAWAERAVRSDLAARGAELVGSGPDEHGVVLDARLPPAEVVGYALALARSSAHTGSFERLRS